MNNLPTPVIIISSALGGLLGIYFLLYSLKKFTTRWAKFKGDLTGKIIIVTGSNTGIGYETAKTLAKMNATIIMACRDQARALEACSRISKELATEGLSNVEKRLIFLPLDLTSFDSVREFSREFNSRFKRLDILINNAALWPSNSRATKDGFEEAIQSNYLSQALLMALLLPKLRATAIENANSCRDGNPKAARIVNVGAKLYEISKYDKDNFQFKPKVGSDSSLFGLHIYAYSKLLQVLHTRLLARRLREKEEAAQALGKNIGRVIVNVLHPGVIHTNLASKWIKKLGVPKWLESFLFNSVFVLMSCTPEEGIQTTLHCALDEDVESVSGEYFNNCCPTKLNKYALDNRAADRLGAESESILGVPLEGNTV